MSEKEDNLLFTLSVDYVYDIIDESEIQISVGKDLLDDFIKSPPANKGLVPLVVEILWSNFSILKILDEEIETAVLRENKETGEDEFLLIENSINVLQQLMVARHYANLALNKISHSMSMH